MLGRNKKKQNQNPDVDIEPYDPDYAPLGSPRREEPVRNRGESGGCFRYFMVITLSTLILAALGTSVMLYGIWKTGDTTTSIFDAIFGDKTEVTQINVRQLILAVQQEAWLETVRETQALDVTAKTEMPGILPGTRSMRYQAFVTVTAGVDMKQMDETDFIADGGSLTVILPNAQIRDCILDQEASRFYERSCNYIGCGDLEEILVSKALETAAIQEQDRILTAAWDNAAEWVQTLGYNVGFETVNIQRDSTFIDPVAREGTCYNHVPLTPTPSPEATTTP